MNRRSFVRAGMSAAAMSALDPCTSGGSPVSKGDQPWLPLLPSDQSGVLAEKVGVGHSLGTANIFRAMLNSPSAAAAFYGGIDALMFHNKVKHRTRELIILRIGWRTGSEYVF